MSGMMRQELIILTETVYKMQVSADGSMLTPWCFSSYFQGEIWLFDPRNQPYLWKGAWTIDRL